MRQSIHVPVLIIGAGISGLWLLNRLQTLGVDALLVENDAIGGGQTIASQGIIHGGTKYALKGKLTKAAHSASQMTERWQRCFDGSGEIDLSEVSFLSHHHTMWLKSSTSTLKSFISSKVLSSHNEILTKSEYPELFNRPEFHGHLCKLYEKVLDVPSLLEVLARSVRHKIVQADTRKTVLFKEDGSIKSITLKQANSITHSAKHNIFDKTSDKKTVLLDVIKGDEVEITAEHYIFCAGLGNEVYFKDHFETNIMQRRPLKMVWVKFHSTQPPSAFTHIIEKGSTPALTITSHQSLDKKAVWYIGGELAESGKKRSDKEQILFARNELSRLLPWVDLSDTTFMVHSIERAENENNGKRPDSPFVKQYKNSLICWPTKLTLAPALCDIILDKLTIDELKEFPIPFDVNLPLAPLAKPIWEH